MGMLLCLSAFFLLQNFIPGASMRHGIVGGNVSVPHSHPFMVYIVDYNTGEACDGFLVSENYVMTAAHCDGSIIAFLGLNATFPLNIHSSLTVKSIPHPKYNNETYENDIMLLKICDPVTLNDIVQTVALPTSSNDKIPQNCMVMGWGSTQFNAKAPSRVLKELNVTVAKANDCTVPDMICSEGQTGPANGDSGGPLVCGNVAHGIVSNNGKLNNDIVSRYVSITYHLHWIQSVMNKPPKHRGRTNSRTKC